MLSQPQEGSADTLARVPDLKVASVAMVVKVNLVPVAAVGGTGLVEMLPSAQQLPPPNSG